jgi:methyltransferase-like protein
LKIQLSQSQFSARFFTTKQHDTQTIASKPSQFTQYTQCMILDGWEGNLWTLCLAARSFGLRGRLKIQLSQSQFSARFFTTKQHDNQTIALKPSQLTQYTQCMILDAWKGNLWTLCLAARSFGLRGRLKIQLSQSQFSARFFTTKQNDNQTIASKPSQLTQYTQCMILDAWEGNLC